MPKSGWRLNPLKYQNLHEHDFKVSKAAEKTQEENKTGYPGRPSIVDIGIGTN